MGNILENIEKYLLVSDKNEKLKNPYQNKMDLDEAISIFKNSKNKKKILLSFDEDIKEEVEKLISGGLL